MHTALLFQVTYNNNNNNHLISARRRDLVKIKKMRTCEIVDLAVPTDHRVKLKESEKKDK